MELTQRQKIIFRTIVERFTCSAEPVGSRTLMDYLDTPLSSATIRNEMAVLEKAGLLEKTHTSSGRIPSRKGYRYYVANLMKTDLSESAKKAVFEVFAQRELSLDEVLKTASRILSEMTHLTSIASGPDNSQAILKNVQLIPVTDDMVVAVIVTGSGQTETRLVHFREDSSVEDLKTWMDLINEHLTGTPLDKTAENMAALEPLLAAKVSRHEMILQALVNGFMSFAQSKVAVAGRSNMLAQPEFSDVSKVRKLMQILENSELFEAWARQESNIAIPVGQRNELIQIGDCSIITARFHCDSEQGQLMVVGPNRMPYAKVIALTDYMSEVIEEVFGDSPKGGMPDEQKVHQAGSGSEKETAGTRNGPGTAGNDS